MNSGLPDMKKSITSLTPFLFVGIFFFTLQAQYRTAGTVNYQHLLLDYNARSVGMAGASVAVPGKSIGILANPAADAALSGMEAFVGYQLVLDGVWAAPLGVARNYPGIGVFAVTLQGLSSGKVEVIEIGLDGEPLPTGNSAHDEYLSPGISFARSFFESKLYAGITLKGLYHRISVYPDVYSSKAIAFDIGIQYLLLSDRLVAGAVISNLGFEFAPFPYSDSYPLPLIFEAGISYVPRYLSTVRLALDINKIRSEFIGFEPGIEVEVYPKVLFLRAGYRFSQSDLSEQFRKFSGDQDENYIKTNWSTFSAGLGIHFDIEQTTVQIDIGLQFRKSMLPPSPLLSAVIDF